VLLRKCRFLGVLGSPIEARSYARKNKSVALELNLGQHSGRWNTLLTAMTGEPVSRTASTTRKPCWAENSVKRDSGLSKSAFWSPEETLAYSATPGASFAGAA
jgi:hypothetical protein